MIQNLWSHKSLIALFASRSIEARYKSSALGMVWALIQPIMVYGFYIVSFAFLTKSLGVTAMRTGVQTFSTILGLSVFFLFTDVLNMAPHAVVGQQSLVKKVSFPIEAVPISYVLVCGFNFLVSQTIILIPAASLGYVSPNAIIYVPLLLIPIILFLFGLSWVLSATSVFIRDISILIPLTTSVLMFLSPVFFKANAVPPELQPFMVVNPIALAIDSIRNAVIDGIFPSPLWYLATVAGGFLWCRICYAYFFKVKAHFADAL